MLVSAPTAVMISAFGPGHTASEERRPPEKRRQEVQWQEEALRGREVMGWVVVKVWARQRHWARRVTVAIFWGDGGGWWLVVGGFHLKCEKVKIRGYAWRCSSVYVERVDGDNRGESETAMRGETVDGMR
jgi:hypothetical protein